MHISEKCIFRRNVYFGEMYISEKCIFRNGSKDFGVADSDVSER